MPKTELPITFETPQKSIPSICAAANLKGKEINEVYHSLDAIHTWRDRFEQQYGTLARCVHHSNPDDPPDLTLCFAAVDLEVEHTRLEPSMLGWVDALHRKECPNQAITVPSITFQPKDRKDLLNVMLSRGGAWSEASADFQKWCQYVLGVIHKKTESRSTGLLVIQDTSLIFEDQLGPIADAVHTLASQKPELIQNWTILIHSRSNPVQSLSFLITANEELLVRRSTV